MSRSRLPTRRRSQNVVVEVDGQRFVITTGYYEDGQPGEVFIAGAKIGSALDAIVDDAAVTLSVALQEGVSPHALARSMSRVPDGKGTKAASVIGVALDLLRGRT